MSRQIPPHDGKTLGKWSDRPAPVMERDSVVFPFPQIQRCSRNDALRFLTQQAEWLCSANHGSIGDFSPIAFSGCPRGHRVSRETQCRSTGLTGFWILTLEPERLKNQPAIARNESRGRTLPRRSSCLLF